MERYYFYDDRNLIVYYGEEYSTNLHLIYLGTSDNPKPAMAAAAFLANGRVTEGYRLRELN